MIYGFNSIYDDRVIKDSAILFITGKTPMFNRIMSDRVKSFCAGNEQKVDLEMFSDLAVGNEREVERLTFQQYLLYCNSVRVNGLWYCSVDYASLTKKEVEQLKTHIKSPAKYGKLVVYVMDFRKKLELKKIGAIQNSSIVNMIELDFPKRETLIEVLGNEFSSKGVKVTQDALNLFIMRLGTYYDKYAETISSLCNGRTSINFIEMQDGLKGVTSYVLWDLVRTLTKPSHSDGMRQIKRRRAYKILNTLVTELGARRVLIQLKKQVVCMVELRYYINNGVIPILVPYSFERVKQKIPKSSPLYSMTDLNFKRSAKIASETSLKDWIYIKMIIDRALSDRTELGALKGLTAVVNRMAYPNERIINDLGIKNVLNEGLFELNTLPYKGE